MTENTERSASPLGERKYRKVLYGIVDAVKVCKSPSEANSIIEAGVARVKATEPLCKDVPAKTIDHNVRQLWYDKELNAALNSVEKARFDEAKSIIEQKARVLDGIGLRKVGAAVIADDIRQYWYEDMLKAAVAKVKKCNAAKAGRDVLDREALFIKGTELGEHLLLTDIKNRIIAECKYQEVPVAVY